MYLNAYRLFVKKEKFMKCKNTRIYKCIKVIESSYLSRDSGEFRYNSTRNLIIY